VGLFLIVFLFIGGGFTFMTSSHPWIADVFYLLGALLFLMKFLTWEEAHQQDPKQRVKFMTSGVLIVFVLSALMMIGNHKLNENAVDKPAFDLSVISIGRGDFGDPGSPPIGTVFVIWINLINKGAPSIAQGFTLDFQRSTDASPVHIGQATYMPSSMWKDPRFNFSDNDYLWEKVSEKPLGKGAAAAGVLTFVAFGVNSNTVKPGTRFTVSCRDYRGSSYSVRATNGAGGGVPKLP
jgi:hypothetical protein